MEKERDKDVRRQGREGRHASNPPISKPQYPEPSQHPKG